jgi:hypothetical protein
VVGLLLGLRLAGGGHQPIGLDERNSDNNSMPMPPEPHFRVVVVGRWLLA